MWFGHFTLFTVKKKKVITGQCFTGVFVIVHKINIHLFIQTYHHSFNHHPVLLYKQWGFVDSEYFRTIYGDFGCLVCPVVARTGARFAHLGLLVFQNYNNWFSPRLFCHVFWHCVNLFYYNQGTEGLGSQRVTCLQNARVMPLGQS